MSQKRTFKDWLIATRPWSFPASAMPVLVTLGYLFWKGMEVNWAIGVFTIFNVVLFHAAGNTWSDYKDYKSGVDREDTVGGLSILVMPLAFGNSKKALRYPKEGMSALVGVDEKTAQLQLGFSMLLFISFMVAAFV